MKEADIAKGISHDDSWKAHIGRTVLLGLPLIGAQLAQMALNVTNTLFLGRLGPAELAAAVLGWQLFYVVWMLGSGFGFALMPLVASAVGARDREGVRRFVGMGLCLCFGYALLMTIPLWNARRIFLALGQEIHIATLAEQYVRALQWSLFPQLAVIALRSFLSAMHRPGIVLFAIVMAGVLNAALNSVLITGGLGFPALGMAGAGLSTFVAMTCAAFFLVGYIHWNPALRDHEIFRRFFKLDLIAVKTVFKLGWPIGTMIVAEVALFSASSIMMGWVGAMELAAHGIAVQLSGLAFMIPVGLSAAVTVRVALASGRGDRRAVIRAAATGIFIGVLIACICAILFLSIPRTLIGFYLKADSASAAAVIPYAVSFLTVAAIFQIVDTLQALCSGALRGLKETRIPMAMAIFSYWGVGVPAAYWLTFRAGLGGPGIWWGLAIGLALSSMLLLARLIWRLRRYRALGTAER
ncbi:MAG: MATE family efflux transporter [Burkholderiaceae bacterium]